MRPDRQTWALTPEGHHKLEEVAAHVPTSSLAAELNDAPGADFGDRRHALILPFLAPAGTEAGVKRLLQTSSFETNVMLISRFPKAFGDPYLRLVERFRTAVAKHGLQLQVASDGNVEDTLWANVVTYMWSCKYAIVVVDGAAGQLNENVLIEVGGMLMTGRRCAILRDKSVPNMPTDLVGHIYKEVDLSDHDAAEAAVHRWLTGDLGLPRCPNCPQ
jgi:hypothetical protein